MEKIITGDKLELSTYSISHKVELAKFEIVNTLDDLRMLWPKKDFIRVEFPCVIDPDYNEYGNFLFMEYSDKTIKFSQLLQDYWTRDFEQESSDLIFRNGLLVIPQNKRKPCKAYHKEELQFGERFEDFVNALEARNLI